MTRRTRIVIAVAAVVVVVMGLLYNQHRKRSIAVGTPTPPNTQATSPRVRATFQPLAIGDPASTAGPTPDDGDNASNGCSIHVMNAHDGSPIRSAAVGEVLSNEDGVAVLQAAGQQKYRVAAPGFAPAEAICRAGAVAVVRLVRAVEVSGVVTSDGAPVDAADVTCRVEFPAHREASIRTGEKGNFRIKECPAGELELHVAHASYAPVLHPLGATPPGGVHEDVHIELTGRGVIAHGVVQRVDGEPIPWADVVAVVETDSNAYGVTELATTRTDLKGKFQLGPVPREAVWIVAVTPQGAVGEFKGQVLADREIVVLVPDGLQITGTVWASGDRVEGATVRVAKRLVADDAGQPAVVREWIWERTGQGMFYRSTTTDVSGSFRFDGLGAGRHLVLAEHRDYGAVHEEVDAGDHVTLELGGGGTIVGEVLRTNGESYVGGGVVVAALLDPATGKPMSARRAPIQKGHFAISNADPGRHTLSGYPEGAATPAPMDVEVRLGSTTYATLVIPNSGTLRGRVVDHEDVPVAAARVAVAQPVAHSSTGAWGPSSSAAITDDDGYFVLENAGDEGHIFISHTGFESKLVDFVMEPDGDLNVGVVNLQPGDAQPFVQVGTPPDWFRRP